MSFSLRAAGPTLNIKSFAIKQFYNLQYNLCNFTYNNVLHFIVLIKEKYLLKIKLEFYKHHIFDYIMDKEYTWIY